MLAAVSQLEHTARSPDRPSHRRRERGLVWLALANLLALACSPGRRARRPGPRHALGSGALPRRPRARASPGPDGPDPSLDGRGLRRRRSARRRARPVPRGHAPTRPRHRDPPGGHRAPGARALRDRRREVPHGGRLGAGGGHHGPRPARTRCGRRSRSHHDAAGSSQAGASRRDCRRGPPRELRLPGSRSPRSADGGRRIRRSGLLRQRGAADGVTVSRLARAPASPTQQRPGRRRRRGGPGSRPLLRHRTLGERRDFLRDLP